MTNRCKDCARLELGLKWWFCTKDGRHIKEFDGKTYIPDPNWKGCEENFVRRDKVQYLPKLYDALFDAANRLCGEPRYRGQYACKSCVVKDSCQVRKWYELLEKVRDGK